MDLNIFTMDLHRGYAMHEGFPACARGLEAHEDDLIARLGQEALQMVQDATAGGHATRRHDHMRPLPVAEGDGLLDRIDVGHFRGQRMALRLRQMMFIGELQQDFGGLAGHRAIQNDGHVGYAALLLQADEQVQDHLGAPHGKCRHYDDTAPLGTARHRFRKDRAGIDVRVLSVTVGGLGNEPVAGR